jgi:hypothetical protein
MGDQAILDKFAKIDNISHRYGIISTSTLSLHEILLSLSLLFLGSLEVCHGRHFFRKFWVARCEFDV